MPIIFWRRNAQTFIFLCLLVFRIFRYYFERTKVLDCKISSIVKRLKTIVDVLKMSFVWRYFDKVTKQGNPRVQVECKICHSKLLFNYNTSCMWKHLKTKHCEEVSLKNNSRDTSIAEGVLESESTAITRQTRITHYVSSRPYSENSSVKRKLDKELINMIAKDMQPLSIVEDEGFRNFVQKLDPKYVLPSRKTTVALMEKEFDVATTNLLSELKEIEYVGITTDTWTSRNNDSFIAITCHYFDSQLDLKSRLLEISRVKKQHTSENLAAILQEAFIKWDIEKKVVGITTDNAANFLSAVRSLNVRHIPCFAHTLNLVVKESIRSCNIFFELKEKIKTVVSHFKRSATAKLKLEKAQETLQRPILKLVQDVETRWNSTYIMVNRFIMMKEPMSVVLVELDDLPPFFPSDWKIAEECLKILKPFFEVTVEMSQEKYVSISKVIPIVRSLQKITLKLAHKFSAKDIMVAAELALFLHENLTKRCGDYENSRLLSLTTLLDPRFKKLAFTDPKRIEIALKYIESELKFSRSSKDPPLNEITGTGLQERNTANEIWKEFDIAVQRHNHTLEYVSSASDVEISTYFSFGNIPRNALQTNFWKENQNRFPQLTRLMKKFMCIQATSVPSERIFSKSGELISCKRSRLSEKNVKMCMFLNKN